MTIHAKGGTGGQGLSKYGGVGGNGGNVIIAGDPKPGLTSFKKIIKKNPSQFFSATHGGPSMYDAIRPLFAIIHHFQCLFLP